jgi:flagellar hook-associated protein 1 FlgK
MGTSTLMGIGTRAMMANFAALQTTGNNIANANTEGYSRQQAQLVTSGGQYTGAGFFGQGVDVATVTRSYDAFLTKQAITTNSVASADASRLDQLSQLENIFGLGEAGVGNAAGQLLNAFVDVANNPQDSSARQVVLTRATDLAARFKSAADQLSALQSGVTQDIKSSVGTVNGLAKQVAALNNQISAQRGTGHTPNDLLDQRDLLVKQISSYIGVSTIQADDGSVGLFVGGGQALVLGATANTLKAIPDAFDPSKVQLALAEGSSDRPLLSSSIDGGSMAGLLKFQDEDLTQAAGLLGQMAVAVTGAINQQQSLGLDLGQPPGSGSPILAVGSPRVLSANTNTGDAAISVSVSDFTHVQPSDYELRFDGTNYTMTRLSDNSQAGGPYTAADLAAGIDVDGMTVQLNTGTAQSGDRFILQPVSSAAQEMKSVLSNPNGIAAASPVVAQFATTNKGTATAGSLGAVSNTLDRTLTANISFVSDTGDYTYDMVDASNNVVSSGTGTWTAGQPIALNGFELNLNGVPKNGDSVSVSPTTSAANNNGNALGFVALANSAFVGATTAGNGSLIPGKSITDAYASAVSSIGVRVQSGKSAASISASVASTAESTRADKAGVNLDEEAARLIQFQQSYQASAKVLQVAQAIFDTLLQATGA